MGQTEEAQIVNEEAQTSFWRRLLRLEVLLLVRDSIRVQFEKCVVRN